jgi:hypothetical protein
VGVVLDVVAAAQKGGMQDVTLLPSGTVFVTPTPPPPGVKPPCGGAACPDPIRIFTDSDGAIFWNGSVIDAAALEQNLKNAAVQKPLQSEIHIEPHHLATYGDLEKVLAAAKKAGMEKSAIYGRTSTTGGSQLILGTVN